MSKITFRCARRSSPDCHGSFDVDEDELTGGQRPADPAEIVTDADHLQPDPGFLPDVPLPEGWVEVEDREYVCPACLIEDELAEPGALEP